MVKRLGPSARRLDSQQRRRIEELAQTKEITCPRCGSARLSSGDIAHPHTGDVGVWVWCRDEDAHGGRACRKQYIRFSTDEARSIDL